ncbi:cysteine hydrolase [Candidatus Thorarchaeota archaeon]|nr:MAG: cysteine hydrolase [Candidatus Thorarchaeota archaeon]
MKIDPKKTSLIVVDMLNDFVRDDGALVVPGAKALVSNQKKLLEAARDAEMMIVYLTDNHEPDDDEFEKWPPHAVVGTWGAKIIDELEPRDGSHVVPKRRYSGFFGTDLDLRLREAGVGSIVLVGVLTDICVMYTSADASARTYDVVVVTDATDSTSRDAHEFALGHMKEVHGSTLATTKQVLDAIE